MSAFTSFKCTTCSILFSANEDLKNHHRCDWHRYNLKRKLADMPPVPYEIFQRKLELLASTGQISKGDAHLKKQTGVHESSASCGADTSTSPPPPPREPPVNYPSNSHCFFDNKVSQSTDENVSYMSKVYSFFIPDSDYLKDKEGLIAYLGAKVFEGYQCLYCNKPFKSLIAVRGHMISKGHTSIGSETEEQEEELQPFYDFSDSYKELNLTNSKNKAVAQLKAANENESDWENEASDDDEEEEAEELAELMARHGLEAANINDYGNLVIPGRGEAAHRSVAFVYKQHLPTKRRDPSVRLALMHARQVRALTENGELDSERTRQLSLVKNGKEQLRARMHREQNYKLKLGVNANKLNRVLLRAEKYFI